ncbi:DUF1120 domain-containing protein [Escherichia coli]|uniref:DUF1120 domain-containing protein n=1 Tax=Escherichia coli TaxID=562 RepID=UPI00148EC2EB|nr:DUF1120 domain-containing protein [Escherichia coli]QJU26258.1 DUF1120 domain-containing protein [Escherichia coli]HBE6261923.1 DUF1120 domain-containing protein [Escherichia coli]
MRKIIFVIALTVTMIGVQSAHADEATTALMVKGKIIPGSCTPTLSDGGKIDYGTISSSSLFDDSNSLGVKNMTLHISCSDSGYVGFTATDNRSDSLPEHIEVVNVKNNDDYRLFGLGKTAEDKVIGAFTIDVDTTNIKVDGKNYGFVYILYSTNGTSWLSNTVNIRSYSDKAPNIEALINKTGVGVRAFKEAEIPLVINTSIVDARDLSVTDKVMLDGNVTFNIIYL